MVSIKCLNAIKNILDYALKKEKESTDIPEAHQKLVMERFDKVRKNPDRLQDWDKAKLNEQLYLINQLDENKKNALVKIINSMHTKNA